MYGYNQLSFVHQSNEKVLLLILHVDDKVVKTMTTAITTSTANNVMPCFHTVTGEFPVTRIKNQAEDTQNGRYILKCIDSSFSFDYN